MDLFCWECKVILKRAGAGSERYCPKCFAMYSYGGRCLSVGEEEKWALKKSELVASNDYGG